MIREADLVGTWKLASHSAFVGRPQGILIYCANQVMSVIITGEAMRGQVSTQTVIAYAGTFSIDGNHVLHHVEVSDKEDRKKSPQARYVTLKGDRLFLSEGPNLGEGFVVEWVRSN